MRRGELLIIIGFFVANVVLYAIKFPVMLTFDADQEYYAKQYVRIVKERQPTLLGIETSIGGMFVGPLYTYATTFIYWLFRGNPLSVFVITILIATTQPSLTYIVFNKLGGRTVGLFGALFALFCVALWSKVYTPSVINFLYPLGLMFFYVLAKLPKNKELIIWLAVLLGLSLHIHFSLFVFFPVVIIYGLIKGHILTNTWKDYLISGMIILIFASPLLLFEVRHRFFITGHLLTFLQQQVSGGSEFSIIKHGSAVIYSMLTTFTYALGINTSLAIMLLLLSLFAIVIVKKLSVPGIFAAAFTIGVSLTLFIFYRGPLPDYYFYYLLAPFFYIATYFLVYLSSLPFGRLVYLYLVFFMIHGWVYVSSAVNPYHYFIKRDVAQYIKSQTQDKTVKILYDTDLGLGFGFNYLLDWVGVKQNNQAYDEVYQIVMRENLPGSGTEFRQKNSPRAIKVVKLPKF